MGLTIKSLQIGEKSRNKFKAHKQYDVVNSNSSSLGAEVYYAEYQTGSLNNWTTASSEPTTTNGYYRNIIHHSINTMFYRNYTNNPGETVNAGGATPQNQKRILDRKAVVVSLSQKKFGEKVYEGSFEVIGKDSVRIIDDKQGNLVDPDLSTDYMIESSSELLRLSFNEAHEFLGEIDGADARYRMEFQQAFSGSKYPYVSNFRLDDTSIKRTETIAHNLQFEERAGSFGTHAIFNGVQNLHGANYHGQGNYIMTNRYDINRDFKYGPSDNFAVAFWINLPVSQSVTQSLEGIQPSVSAFGNVNSTTTFDHDTNVIIEKSGIGRYRNGPFVIETYNQHSANATDHSGSIGKIAIKRGNNAQTKHDATPQLTSSTAINDGEWHHIVYQYNTGSNSIWIDGVMDASGPDGATDKLVRNTPIQIGGHIKGWTTASSELSDPEESGGRTPTSTVKWHWTKQGGYGVSSPKNVTQALSGSLDEVRVFNRALTHLEIAFLSASNNTNVVGNMFYQNGFACITHPHSKYQDILNTLDFQMYYKGCISMTELEYTCNVKSHEFDGSENITLRKNEDPDEITMKDFATSSAFSPFITQIGLYNDQHELLALAKLGQPLQKPKQTDLTFVVRMDKL